jgi:hypothetical protein
MMKTVPVVSAATAAEIRRARSRFLKVGMSGSQELQ